MNKYICIVLIWYKTIQLIGVTWTRVLAKDALVQDWMRRFGTFSHTCSLARRWLYMVIYHNNKEAVAAYSTFHEVTVGHMRAFVGCVAPRRQSALCRLDGVACTRHPFKPYVETKTLNIFGRWWMGLKHNLILRSSPKLPIRSFNSP